MNIDFGRLAAMILVSACAAPPASFCQSLPPVNLGATSFLDGGAPAGPGLYGTQYLLGYHATRFADREGDTIPLPSPELTVWTSLTQLVYLWGKEIPWLSAQPALDVIIPVTHIELEFEPAIPAPRDAGGGLGDLTVGPALQFKPLMGKHGPLFVHRLEAQFILPTGDYSRDAEINPGSGIFSFDPYWAATVFFSPQWTLSWRAHYLWNDENDRPSRLFGPHATVQPGQAFHLNFATEYELWPKGLRLGFNGYFLRQITPAKVNGAELHDYREQVIGLGPGAMWSFSPENHLFANLYWETGAQNRPEGMNFVLRYVHKF